MIRTSLLATAVVTAATNGVNGEFNSDLLSNVTSKIIVPGIDKQRGSILQEITNRRCLGISSYNLMQALSDAIRYHAACSTDVGVAAAGPALSQSQKTTLPTTVDVAGAIDTMSALNAKMQTVMNSAPAKPAAAAAAKKGERTGDAASQPAGVATSASTTAPQSKTTSLVGDQIDYLQCPSLTAEGMLPSAAVPAASTLSSQGAQNQYGQR